VSWREGLHPEGLLDHKAEAESPNVHALNPHASTSTATFFLDPCEVARRVCYWSVIDRKQGPAHLRSPKCLSPRVVELVLKTVTPDYTPTWQDLMPPAEPYAQTS
jgi:hypothetical protein